MNRLQTQHAHGRRVVFGEVAYLPGGTCGPRAQHDYQLVILHSGSLTLHWGAQIIPVAAGQAVLLPPRQWEYFLFDRERETRHSWCAVNPSLVPGKLRPLLGGGVPVPAAFPAQLAALFSLARERMRALTGEGFLTGKAAEQNLEIGAGSGPGEAAGGADPLEEAHYCGIALALLTGFASAARQGAAARQPSDEALGRLERFVSREYHRPLTLGDLAAAAGVSRQHLLKLFRERRWPTPTQYLYGKRMEAAAELLSHTGLPVGEIAGRCGFASPFHFSRKFRQTHGQSPKAWRARAWRGG